MDTNISSISLNWTAPGFVSEYRVEWSSGKKPILTGNTFAVLSNLLPGTSYTITITAAVGDNVTGEPYTFSAVTSNGLFR